MSMAEHTEKKDNLFCECGGKLIQKVSAPPVNLVGGGWYRDGYISMGNTQKDLDKELRVYDKHRDKQAQEKYDRELTNV
jgi:hypothetical protein